MGARVVERQTKLKMIDDYTFENFGGHLNGDYEGFPYITIAVAIGSETQEIEDFMKVFIKGYQNFIKKQSK